MLILQKIVRQEDIEVYQTDVDNHIVEKAEESGTHNQGITGGTGTVRRNVASSGEMFAKNDVLSVINQEYHKRETRG